MEKFEQQNNIEHEIFSEALNRINYEILRRRFAIRMEQCGIHSENVNFVFPERIKTDLNLGADGTYDSVDNLISLDEGRIDQSARNSNTPLGIYILRSVAHEEGHAVSKSTCQGLEDAMAAQEGENVKVEISNGYARQLTIGKHEKTTTKLSYFLFDEGVNEKLAREITDEYLESDPSFADVHEIQRYKVAFENHLLEKPYDIAVLFVDALIRKIATDVGTGEAVIWKALQRGKFEGQSLDDSEIKDLFKEGLPSDFLSKLSALNSEDQNARLIKLMDYLKPSQFQKLKEMALKFLKRS